MLNGYYGKMRVDCNEGPLVPTNSLAIVVFQEDAGET